MATLSGHQLHAIATLLGRQRDSLLGTIADETSRNEAESYSVLAGEAPDPGDEAMADLLVDTGHALEEHHRAELADVGAALRRLAAGTYGRCTDCGSGVDYERLRSCPTATRCTPCQQQHERTFAGALRPSL